jgi:hypothetical protein
MVELMYATPAASEAVYEYGPIPRATTGCSRRAAVAIPVRFVRLRSELQDRTGALPDVRRRILGIRRPWAAGERHLILDPASP